MSVTVGVIGLGPMGGNIARNLLKEKFKVVGFDQIREQITALEDVGIEIARDCTEVAEKADIIITSLPNMDALDNAIKGILGSDKPDQIILECSTLEVGQKIEAAAKLEEFGKIMLDAQLARRHQCLPKEWLRYTLVVINPHMTNVWPL